MGLSAGGGGVICGSKRKASGMTDIMRQNEDLCVVPLWFKNRNQRVICAGRSYKGGGLIRGVTPVLRKRWASRMKIFA